MLKKRGILVLLMCKLEALNFFLKHHFTSISRGTNLLQHRYGKL